MDLMRELITTCVVNNIPILFEPTSVPKSLELLKSINDVIKSGTFGSSHKLVDYITPNTYELAAMANFAAEHCLAPKGVPSPAVVDRHIATNPDLDPQIVANALTLSYVSSALIIKLGAKGSVVVSPIHGDLVEVEMRHILPITVESVVNSNGAGDSLVGGILAGLAGLKGFDGPGMPFVTSTQLEGIVARAQRAAVASLQSQQSVSDEICPEMLLA
ncbi:hypothetical protein EV182_004090 [Spiromyces aspiralis]|uniref:Uncharacterized protein n=1 Tax=Spiromyces aspiralis TaxID=68401 RepID=A0ACC1HBW8_9FUNG|nr:hypothetical protein EV182_004090 [Spiromyces aspiralis]